MNWDKDFVQHQLEQAELPSRNRLCTVATYINRALETENPTLRKIVAAKRRELRAKT